jgi:tetratricopeptide (TPR) repeat protein
VAESLADIRERLGALDEAAAAYALARELSNSETSIARLWRKTGVLHLHQSRYPSALRLYTRARARLLAAGVEDEGGELAELAVAYAGVRHRQGRYSECLEWAERARREAEASANQSCLAHSFMLIDYSAMALGTNHGAYALRALSIYEEIGDLVGQANVLDNLGGAAWEGGRWQEALEYFERSKSISDRSGDALGTSYSNYNIAEVLVAQGHADSALDILHGGLAAFETSGFSWGLAYGNLLKARAALRKGSLLEAEPLIAVARDQFTEIGARSSAVFECDLVALELRMMADPGANFRGQIDSLRHDFAGQEGDERLELPLLRMSCVAYAWAGDYDLARGEVDRAIKRAGELGARGDLAEAYTLRRDLASAFGRPVERLDSEQADNLSASLGVITPRRWDLTRGN